MRTAAAQGGAKLREAQRAKPPGKRGFAVVHINMRVKRRKLGYTLLAGSEIKVVVGIVMWKRFFVEQPDALKNSRRYEHTPPAKDQLGG